MIRGRPTASVGRSEAAATHIAWQLGHSDPVLQQLQERIVNTPKNLFRALDPGELYGFRDAGCASSQRLWSEGYLRRNVAHKVIKSIEDGE